MEQGYAWMPWIVSGTDQSLMPVLKGNLYWELACMSPQGLVGSRDLVLVCYMVMEQVDESQCVVVEDTDVGQNVKAEEGIEAVAAVERGHCLVFDFDKFHSL